MIYPIYVYGTSVLRKKTKDISRDYPGLKQLIEDMFETMRFSEGVGLAAPQIGLSARLFVVDATGSGKEEEGFDEDDEDLSDFKKVFINPRITKYWGEAWTFNEGCLSIPNLREDVDRPERVRIEYYDEDFNFHDEEFDGVRARIIQHEYDHLEGILFVDKINPLRKRLISGKLNAISKGKVDIHYKIKIPAR
ncbi:MAG: peptide deformylase [Bacteroidales bacterium]|nr:peptide deformylase [Bacteroidales bacterium]